MNRIHDENINKHIFTVTKAHSMQFLVHTDSANVNVCSIGKVVVVLCDTLIVFVAAFRVCVCM